MEDFDTCLNNLFCSLDLSQYSKSQLIRYICGEDLAGFYTGHFWFMYALLGIYLIFPLIAACINSGKSKGYLILLAGMIGVFEFVVTDVNTALGYLSQTFGMNELSSQELKCLTRLAPMLTACFIF